MKAVVGIATLAMVALGRAAASGALPAIAVEAPGVACPSAQAVRAALARLGAAPGGETSPAFRLVVERAAAGARVQLRDLAGRTLLVRQLPATAPDCAQAAQAIALIVERHFRALEWSPAVDAASTPAPASPGVTSSAPPTTPPPLAAAPAVAGTTRPGTAPPMPPGPNAPSPVTAPIAPPITTAAPPSTPAAPSPALPGPATDPPAVQASSSPTSAPTVATSAPRPSSPSPFHAPARDLPRLAFGAGPAFWTRGSTFAVAVAGRWRILAHGPLEVGASVLLPPGQTSAAVGSGGSVHVDAVPVMASVGLVWPLGRLAAGMHAGALWTIERGQSESIVAPATAWRAILGAGAGISAAWPLTGRLRLAGAVDGYRTVLGRSYAISGVPGIVLDPSPWQATVALGVEWVFSP